MLMIYAPWLVRNDMLHFDLRQKTVEAVTRSRYAPTSHHPEVVHFHPEVASIAGPSPYNRRKLKRKFLWDNAPF